jgi:hypothetical protein
MLSFLSSVGCIFGDPPTAPTNYTIVSPVSEIFQDTLELQGAKAYAFIVGNPDPLRVTLASVTSTTSGAAVTASLKLTIGIWDGTASTCTQTFSTTTTSGLVAQYLQVVTAGTYCVVVADPGTLTAPVNFAVRIVHS